MGTTFSYTATAATAAPTYIGMTIAEIEAAIAVPTDLDTTDATDLAYIDQLITVCGRAATNWGGRTWWWVRDTGLFQTNTKTVAAVASSGAARSSNVTTITTTAAHGLAIGQFVKVAVTTGTGFDGVWKVASVPSSTTFTYAEVGDDVGAAAAGGGSVYVISYPARSIDLVGSASGSATMATIRLIEGMFYDDERRILPMTWRDMRTRLVTMATFSASQPSQYCQFGEPPQLFLYPAPASAYNIHLDIIKRHTKITNAASADTDLIVPGEWHFPVYVEGAIWLRKHRTEDVATLSNCQAWVEAMQNMAESDPGRFDEDQANLFPDAQRGGYPVGHRVIELADGDYLIEGTPTL